MAGKTIPQRDQTPREHRWDLTPLFKSDKKWETEFVNVETQLPSYQKYNGHLKDSVLSLKEAIEFHLRLNRQIEALYTYAHLKNDEDKSNQLYLGFQQRALNLLTRCAEVSSFMTPEIQSIPDETIDQFMKDPTITEFKFYLEKILRYKPHTCSEMVEKILAMSREIASAPSQVFGQLDNVDLKFGTLTDDNGKKCELSHGNFMTFLASPSRKLRKKAFFQYYQAYQDHKHTLAATLSNSIKKDHFYSRVRNFDTCRASSLFGDNIQEAVYENLIDSVKRNLKPLFQYLNFRKRTLGIEELHFYDTYVPIIEDVDFKMSFEEAVDVGVAALEPLGEEYCNILKQGLLGGWVDRYENRGKRSGAYSSGCYDSPPYILLNYDDQNLNSLYTLIHEAGHSMHSYYARKYQPYVDHDYTIFVAEVASTFNENLLSRYLLETYNDNLKMQAYILNREIDNIRATLFRQTMFAEFEQITHAIVEANGPLTLEVMTDKYSELLQIYFGDSLVLDPELSLEYLRIPHFYSAFYVYKYATGVSAATTLAKNVIDEGESVRRAYLDFLALGGSKFPLDQLMDAGVDMTSSEPTDQAISHFESLVELLIEMG